MLKLNTVLTALAVVLMAVLGWEFSTALKDIHETHDSVTAQAVTVQEHTEELEDHEKRIRETETAVTEIKTQEHVVAKAPKQQQN